MASGTKHPSDADRPTHVVIVGGGFAGIGCARGLAGEDGVRVTLIDQHNYHQFQPLLYQVATSQLAATSIASVLRKTFSRLPQRRREAGRGDRGGHRGPLRAHP